MNIRNNAAATVRACADAIIEQRERQAKGWDQGRFRDDDTVRSITIEDAVKCNVEQAMYESKLAV